jgi:hypothetical protein
MGRRPEQVRGFSDNRPATNAMPSTSYPFAHPAFHGLIGAVREDITPLIGIYARNWGASEHDIAEGIHRPLTLTALAISSNSQHQTPSAETLLLISADLGWWRTQEDEWYVRKAILDAASLQPEQLTFALTHTHSGPSICREDADKPGGHLIAPYLEQLRDAAITAAKAAIYYAEPATLSWRYGRCGLAANRDLPDPDQRRVICGYNPDETADDTLLVGRVTSEEGQILATIVNYACHPVTLAWQNKLISPDFVGAMREIVEENTGEAPCLFLQGASGELAPRDTYTGDTGIADRNGRELGFAVMSALEGMLPSETYIAFDQVVESGAPLAVWKNYGLDPPDDLKGKCIEVDLPLKDLPALEEIETQIAATQERAILERLNRSHRVRRLVGDGKSMSFPFWVWRVGDAILLGTGAEPYSILQQRIRAEFPGMAIAVINVVNGWGGYMPPAELYDNDQYQVWQTPFAKGSLEILIEAAIVAIRELLEWP